VLYHPVNDRVSEGQELDTLVIERSGAVECPGPAGFAALAVAGDTVKTDDIALADKARGMPVGRGEAVYE